MSNRDSLINQLKFKGLGITYTRAIENHSWSHKKYVCFLQSLPMRKTLREKIGFAGFGIRLFF
jgi:hypothetical protein